MIKRLPYWIVLLFGIALLHSCIEEPEVYPNNTRGNFDALWEIIDTRYCYLDYKEIDWDAIYQEYSPKIDTVSSKYVLFDLMAKMLAELKDGHVNLYSSFDRSRYTKWYSDYAPNYNGNIVYSDKYLGENYRVAGGIHYKTIADGEIGYMRYSSFTNDISHSSIREIFEIFKNCRGLIIDVRNNGGGNANNSAQLASYFFTEKTLTNHIQHKTGPGHSDFSEPKPVYTTPDGKISWERPVVVLMNRMSYSATNDFICRMQYAPKATLVGDKSGGGGGLPFSSELPNGWMIRFSASPLLDAEKRNIEWGIDPGVAAEQSTEDEELGIDSLIEMGISIIKR